MRILRIALLTSLFFTGIFAGLMFTFMLVIQRMLATLSASEYTQIMQGLIHGADNPPVVPAIVMVAVVAPLVALFQLRHNRQTLVFRLTLIAWIIFVAGVLIVTVGFNAPINEIIVKWSSQSPPADWMQIRDRWNALNIIRTPASVLSFLLFSIALSTHSAAVFQAERATPKQSQRGERG